MLKKIQWLVFFASDRTQTWFQRDVRRKPFSKQVAKLEKSHWKVWQAPAVQMSQVCPYIWNDSSTTSKWSWNHQWIWKETQVIKSAHLYYHSRNVQCLARQGLAVQDDDEDRSNFIQLLRLQSKIFPKFADWLSKKTERYTSHNVQNEIINLMSNQIMRNLLEPVRSYIFSVMCD